MERLMAVLDAYGAEPARWPEAERERLLLLVATDAEAARLQREAAALDRLLSKAAPQPLGADRLNRLSAQILAGFEAENGKSTHTDGAGGNVVAFPGPGRRLRNGPVRAPMPMAMPRAGWVATALAASFALGIYLGSIGVGGWTLDPVSTITEASLGNEQAVQLGGLISDDELDDEELI